PRPKRWKECLFSKTLDLLDDERAAHAGCRRPVDGAVEVVSPSGAEHPSVRSAAEIADVTGAITSRRRTPSSRVIPGHVVNDTGIIFPGNSRSGVNCEGAWGKGRCAHAESVGRTVSSTATATAAPSTTAT